MDKEYVFEEYGTIVYAVTVTAKSEKEAWDKYYSQDHDSHEETEYNCGDVELIHNPEGYAKHLGKG